MVAKAERSRTNRGHDLDLLMPRDVICHVTIAAPHGLLELTQNVTRSSYGHSTASLKISYKSVQPFSRNFADKELSIARFTRIDPKRDLRKRLQTDGRTARRTDDGRCTVV